MMMSATRSVSPTTSSMLRTRKTTPKANNNNIRKPTKQRSTNAMATFTSPSSRRSSWSIARSSARCGVQTKTTLTTTTMMKKNESNNKTVKEQQQQQRIQKLRRRHHLVEPYSSFHIYSRYTELQLPMEDLIQGKR